MFTKESFKIWLIIGVGSLGVLAVILLLQHHGRKQLIVTAAPSSAVQTRPETQKRWVAPPSTKSPTMKTPQQGAQTEPSQSKKLETIPMDSDASETEPALDEEDTIPSLVDSLSDEDLEILKGLFTDFLSDEDLEKLDRKTTESLKEFEEIVPEIMEHKAKLGEIIDYTNNISQQDNWHQDKEKYEEVVKNDELIKEMLVELRTLQIRASSLENFLLEADFHSIGPRMEKEWIRRLGKHILEPIPLSSE